MFNKSFPINLIKIHIGVIITKNTKPITIGDIKFPNNIPNLDQILFNLFSNLGFKKLIIKKVNAITIAHILIFPPVKIGHNEIITKKIEKTIPKLLSELMLRCFFCISQNISKFKIKNKNLGLKFII